MTIGPISAAGIGQSVLAASDSTQLQQALQTLQSSLNSGDLGGAQSAFQVVQQINQGLASSSGTSLSSNTQLSSDLNTLGSALSSGDVSAAQSAFASVQNDLKGSSAPSHAAESAVATESEQLVSGLLSSLNTNSPSTAPDTTTSLLESVYGAQTGLNVYG